MTDHVSISVVVPVYRNRRQLAELHRRLTQVLEDLTNDYEVVFVDDGSRDGSLERLQQCREQDRRVRVLAKGENQGQHRAVVAGLSAAWGEVVVVMDADLQDPPEAIPSLVEALGNDDGVVFARRVARFESRPRHVTSLVFKRLLRVISGSRIPKDTGMFFVATGRVVKAATQLSRVASYVPLLLEQTGCALTSIAIDKESRADDESTYDTRRRVRLGMEALTQALRWPAALWHHRRPRQLW